MILLALFLALMLFGFAYLFLDRLEQRAVNRAKERNDVDRLIRMLRSPWLGMKAARALGETSDERAVEPLIRAMDDRREDVRKSAAEALGKLGDRRAIGPLSHALDDRYDSVRSSARRALDNISKSSGHGPGFA